MLSWKKTDLSHRLRLRLYGSAVSVFVILSSVYPCDRGVGFRTHQNSEKPNDQIASPDTATGLFVFVFPSLPFPSRKRANST